MPPTRPIAGYSSGGGTFGRGRYSPYTSTVAHPNGGGQIKAVIVLTISIIALGALLYNVIFVMPAGSSDFSLDDEFEGSDFDGATGIDAVYFPHGYQPLAAMSNDELMSKIHGNSTLEAILLRQVQQRRRGRQQCVWNPQRDPVMFHLKTKLGVNYDAGHWFHMAENFMVQHSRLREEGRLVPPQTRDIYYHFDKVGFSDDLNGFTKLMVYLGTAASSLPATLTATNKPVEPSVIHSPSHAATTRTGNTVERILHFIHLKQSYALKFTNKRDELDPAEVPALLAGLSGSASDVITASALGPATPTATTAAAGGVKELYIGDSLWIDKAGDNAFGKKSGVSGSSVRGRNPMKLSEWKKDAFTDYQVADLRAGVQTTDRFVRRDLASPYTLPSYSSLSSPHSNPNLNSHTISHSNSNSHSNAHSYSNNHSQQPQSTSPLIQNSSSSSAVSFLTEPSSSHLPLSQQLPVLLLQSSSSSSATVAAAAAGDAEVVGEGKSVSSGGRTVLGTYDSDMDTALSSSSFSPSFSDDLLAANKLERDSEPSSIATTAETTTTITTTSKTLPPPPTTTTTTISEQLESAAERKESGKEAKDGGVLGQAGVRDGVSSSKHGRSQEGHSQEHGQQLHTAGKPVHSLKQQQQPHAVHASRHSSVPSNNNNNNNNNAESVTELLTATKNAHSKGAWNATSHEASLHKSVGSAAENGRLGKERTHIIHDAKKLEKIVKQLDNSNASYSHNAVVGARKALLVPHLSKPLYTATTTAAGAIGAGASVGGGADQLAEGGEQRRLVAEGGEARSTTTAAATTVAGTALKDKVCVKYLGTIGGDWPTVQRGHWFPHPGDVEDFRAKIRDVCPRDDALLAAHQTDKLKLVIYQRDLSRKLENLDESVQELQEHLGTDRWEIKVLMHSSSRSPCELAHILQDTSVLLTAHGFQSMLLFFLPRNALLFEVFPFKYYKRAYGPLGAEYGVIHGGVMSPGTLWHTRLLLALVPTSYCMQSKFCRNYARNQDVRLTEHGVRRLVSLISDHIDPSTSSTSSSTTLVPAPVAGVDTTTAAVSTYLAAEQPLSQQQ